MKKKTLSFALVPIAALALAGCVKGKPDATQQDAATASQQLQGFQKNQPVPVFDWSQLRQNLIEIETAQARTTQTTSFFFNQGVQDPTSSCPSIGFPIPATYQLTNPNRIDYNGGNGGGNVSIPQIEANGVYTADTSGTYVVCINAQGQAYANYWEGFVQTVTGPAKWDPASHQVNLVGPPSFNFTKGK